MLLSVSRLERENPKSLFMIVKIPESPPVNLIVPWMTEFSLTLSSKFSNSSMMLVDSSTLISPFEESNETPISFFALGSIEFCMSFCLSISTKEAYFWATGLTSSSLASLVRNGIMFKSSWSLRLPVNGLTCKKLFGWRSEWLTESYMQWISP